ncbi:MAG: tRNA epoxyqueuosine(34) reductase QueG [Sedimentisphaerales bacterium]|nr:tRNA epoxyqueuosine(34) reductase QueG [Sedimentisphaerales bacterium]
MNLEQEIKGKALELGFDAAGITDASPIDTVHVERLNAWLDAGFAGGMPYMHRHGEKRIDPGKLLAGAQSVIVVALNYTPGEGPQQAGTCRDHTDARFFGRVAQYACFQDYHDFMRPLLHELAAFVRERTGKTMRFKVCVDSAPLAERALAVRAGLGFIGKNHMLIHPTLGPEIFLGELISTVKLNADEPSVGTCVSCDRCLRACPTGALRADGQFDASRCISYLTMEHKGAIGRDLAARIGDRLFGCDECVLACPYHDAAPPCTNRRFRFNPHRRNVDLQRILEMTPPSFETEFAGSALHRLGLDRLQRNARICLENLSR